MPVTYRVGAAFTGAASDPHTLDPGTNPVSGDILIVPSGCSNSSGFPGATVVTGFGGTWNQTVSESWGSRRRHNVSVSTDWTTATGAADVDFVATTQDRACGLIIVEGATAWAEAAQTSGSGTSYTPTLTSGLGGYMVTIQHESTASPSTPTGWTKQAHVTATNGLRSLSVFTHPGGTLPSTTPSFSWGTTEGYAAAVFTFTAAAGGTSHAITASGSLTTAGSAAINVRRPMSASGALTTTGTATLAAQRPVGASGAATFAGSATIGVTRPVTASGAATFAGSASIGVSRPVTATGTLTTAGSADIGTARPITATGTATFTGTAAINIAGGATDHPITASGSIVFSDSSASLRLTHTITATGSATFTGGVNIYTAHPLTSSGSATFTGSATTVRTAPITATGTATFTGAADIAATRPLAAAGTITFSGTAAFRPDIIPIILGGHVRNGARTERTTAINRTERTTATTTTRATHADLRR